MEQALSPKEEFERNEAFMNVVRSAVWFEVAKTIADETASLEPDEIIARTLAAHFPDVEGFARSMMTRFGEMALKEALQEPARTQIRLKAYEMAEAPKCGRLRLVVKIDETAETA